MIFVNPLQLIAAGGIAVEVFVSLAVSYVLFLFSQQALRQKNVAVQAFAVVCNFYWLYVIFNYLFG